MVKSTEALWASTEAGPQQREARQLGAEIPDSGWRRLSAGAGAKGPRMYDWARVPIRPLGEPGWEYWVLVRRNISDPRKPAYYACFAPQGTSLEELVRVAGSRWTIEECFEEAKGEVGLDQYEVRLWVGWYRHITLALLAHTFLAVTRATAADAEAAGEKRGP